MPPVARSITATPRCRRRSTSAGSPRIFPASLSAELAREFGLAERDIVKLASNENPRGPGAGGARRDRGGDRRSFALP